MSKDVYTSLDIIQTGQKIHSAIINSGYSVRQIQEMLRLEDPQPIYRWIHGRCMPSTDNLYRLSKIFNIHMEELLVEMGAGDKVDKAE